MNQIDRITIVAGLLLARDMQFQPPPPEDLRKCVETAIKIESEVRRQLGSVHVPMRGL